MTKGNTEKVIKLIKQVGTFNERQGQTNAVILGACVSMVYMGADSSNGTSYSVYCDSESLDAKNWSAYTHKETNQMLERVSDWNAFGYALFKPTGHTTKMFLLHRDEVETGWL